MRDDLMYEADVVVAGAGTAGSAAAIAAADAGARVLLLEQLGGAGGSGCAGLVTPMMSTGIAGNPMCSYVSGEINRRMLALGAARGDGSAFDPGMLGIVLEKMLMERGVRMLFHTSVAGAFIKDGALKQLYVCHKGGTGSAVGRVFIDATGDADVCALAGLETLNGDEETGKNQPVSLRYILGGVNVPDFWAHYSRAEHPDKTPGPVPEPFSGAVTKGDGRTWPYTPLFESAVKSGELTQDDQVYWQFFTIPGRADCVAFNCPEFFDLENAYDAENLTRVQLDGKQAILRQLLFYRKRIPGFERAYIAQIAALPGVRESRRAVTDCILTAEDFFTHRAFEDAICQTNYPVDVHGRKLRLNALDARESAARPYAEIPLRALIVKGANNLLAAGRNLGARFAAQSSARIIPTCRAMGEACGIAAAMALKESPANLRNVSGASVRARMREMGAVFAR